MSATYAPFTMDKFQVTEFHFNTDLANLNDEIVLDFNVSGEYNEKEATFSIYLTFIAKQSEKAITEIKLDAIIFATIKSVFSLKEWKTLDEIEAYFYPNSLGIMFPYLRSYISNATINSDDTVILPLLNLSSLVPDLKNNITIL